MRPRILVSTGTLVGRRNGFDHRMVIKSVGRLSHIDGYELMMLPAYYDKLDIVAADFAENGINTPVIHFEKEIGAYLSRGSAEDIAEAKRLIALNIKMAKLSRAERCVLHLWGGPRPDDDLSCAISALGDIIEMCRYDGLLLMVENAPCRIHDPLSIWREILSRYDDALFTLDSRFAAFHDQISEITAPEILSHVRHVHVSDTAEIPGVFGDIRPILSLGEGRIDFDVFFSSLRGYDGYITIESPVMLDDGDVDIVKLSENCRFVYEYIER